MGKPEPNTRFAFDGIKILRPEPRFPIIRAFELVMFEACRQAVIGDIFTAFGTRPKMINRKRPITDRRSATKAAAIPPGIFDCLPPAPLCLTAVKAFHGREVLMIGQGRRVRKRTMDQGTSHRYRYCEATAGRNRGNKQAARDMICMQLRLRMPGVWAED